MSESSWNLLQSRQDPHVRFVGGVPANARDLSRCPICGEPLKPRQRVCSGRCRAELSRRRQAEARQARDEQVRALLLAALALMGKNEQP